tara:strand:- start:4777 stop:7239 length:2463 start_codon:yes stop_codon:yes gene_type:complete
MSLVFLKNDTNSANVAANDHMKPYDWENNFSTPLVLPVDSQVAYISSTMQRDKVIDLQDPVSNFWLQVGTGQLSIPMPINLNSASGSTDTWELIAARLTGQSSVIGNTDFMPDGTGGGTASGGFVGSYNSATRKFNCTLKQRLQPVIQEVYANRGDSVGGVAAWTAAGGKNEQGLIIQNGLAAGNGIAANTFPAVGNTTLWDIGWKRFTLIAGGKAPGDAPEYVNNTWSMIRTQTGLKRCVYEGAGDELGGKVQFRGATLPGAFGETASTQSLPYTAGLNSLQAIKAADANGDDFINACTYNGTTPNLALTPNVIQVRVEGNEMFVEIMETMNPLRYNQALQYGVWGKCEENDDPATATGNDYARSNMRIIDTINIETWLTAALAQPQNTGGQASQPYSNRWSADPTLRALNQITFTIKWTTPYSFQVWAGTGFNDETGKYEGTAIAGSNYAPGTPYADTYSILYDSLTGGNYTGNLVADEDDSLLVPRYFGDMGFVGWIDRRAELEFRGNFDVIKCFPDTPVTPGTTYDSTLKGRILGGTQNPQFGYFNMENETVAVPPYNVFLNCYRLIPFQTAQIFPAIPNIETTALAFNDGTTVAGNKGMSNEIPTNVVGRLTSAASVASFQKWWRKPTDLGSVYNVFVPVNASPDTNIGVILGWITASDDGKLDWSLLAPNDVEEYQVLGVADVGESEVYNSVHIQLTNLPINGRNGMTSSKTSTIAVIHNATADAKVGADERRIYNHYQNEKNWIDLNNVAEMTLNQLRVYISGDNNAPANFLKDKSDVLIIFRQKPAMDGGVSTQPINKFGISTGRGQTFTKM